MTWKLSDCRAAHAGVEGVRRITSTGLSPAMQRAHEDRGQLLALVDRMRLYLRHECSCERVDYNGARTIERTAVECTCGLSALLRELEER